MPANMGLLLTTYDARAPGVRLATTGGVASCRLTGRDAGGGTRTPDARIMIPPRSCAGVSWRAEVPTKRPVPPSPKPTGPEQALGLAPVSSAPGADRRRRSVDQRRAAVSDRVRHSCATVEIGFPAVLCGSPAAETREDGRKPPPLLNPGRVRIPVTPASSFVWCRGAPIKTRGCA